jgi:hypothetical protein
MFTSKNSEGMDALPPQPLPEGFARHEEGVTFVEKQLQSPADSAVDALAMDPNRLPLLKLEDSPSGRFSMYLLEEVCHMVAAAGTPYVEEERDLSLYGEWRNLYYGECRRDFEWTDMKIKGLRPEYTRLAMMQDLLYIIRNTQDALDHFEFILSAVHGKALIASRVPDSDTIRALALYAFAHFIVPIDGHPSVVSQVKDKTTEEGIFSLLSALCNNPANTGDIRGAFLLLAMYSVLELNMPSKSRMEQLRDFFFSHMQIKSSNEKIKEKILCLYALIAKSDPHRYGNPQDGKIIVEYAQSALMVSCPYISEELTQIWGQHMQTLIDMQKSGQLEVSLKREFVTREAQALIRPSDPNIPHCHPSALPVLRQIVEL